MKRYILTILGIVVLTALIATAVSCQSRIGSKFTGKPLELTLPADFETAVGWSKGDGEKDLLYINTDGVLKVKTYSDFGVLEGSITFK